MLNLITLNKSDSLSDYQSPWGSIFVLYTNQLGLDP
jgi:hypothetical protein